MRVCVLSFHVGTFAGVSAGLTESRSPGEFPTVHTLIVDSKKRLRLPDAEPNQVYAYEPQGEGRFC